MEQAPWSRARKEIALALEHLDGHASMSDAEFAEATAAACIHLDRADEALEHLVSEYSDPVVRRHYARGLQQMRIWMGEIRQGDRSRPIHLVALRDAVRYWWPDRRKLEEDRLIQAA